jgi:ABC-2 type transport system ATP-binding protein
MARMDGPVDPAWTAHEVTLEDVILAYLADGEAEDSNTAWVVPT